MKKTVAFVLSLLLCLSAMPVFAAEDVLPVNDMKGEVTFSFWGTPEEVEIQEKITAEFNKYYPNIKVNLDHVSGAGDFNTAILTRMSGGNAPDVFYLGEISVEIFRDKGLLCDMLPFAQRDNLDLGDYWDGVLSPAGYNEGHMWAFPKDCTPYMIYYNKDHFDELGLEYPSADWTFEDFTETAKKLTVTADNGKTTRYGYWAEHGWCAWFAAAYKNGGAIMNEDCTRLVADPKTAEALQWYFDLANVHNVSPAPEAQTSMGGSATDAFMSGLTSMMIGGRFATYWLKDWDGNYDYTLFPFGEGVYQPLQFVALGIPEASKNKDAAWEFIKFYCGKTGQEINSASGMGLSVMKSVHESGVWLQEWETENNREMLTAQFNNTKDLPFHPDWAKLIDDVFYRNLMEAAGGLKSAAEALDLAVAEGNAYLENNGK